MLKFPEAGKKNKGFFFQSAGRPNTRRSFCYALSPYSGLDAIKAFTVFFIILMGDISYSQAASLFSDAPAGTPAFADSSGTVLRSRAVQVDLSQLQQSNGLPVSPGVELTLNLFTNETYTAQVDRVESHISGGFSLVGTLKGLPQSQVMIAVHGDQVMATVVATGLLCQIRPMQDGVHGVLDLNPSAFPPGADPIVVPPVPGPVPMQDNIPDDGALLDVLVVYTPAARQGAGSTTAMQALIDLAETETNTAFSNSGINPRIRVVHTAEVQYSETGFSYSGALNNLRDGDVPEALPLREQYGADLVVMLVEGDSSLCGIAFFMGTVSSSFASSAVSVTRRSCATGNFTFGHEIGHNMGARHHREADPNDGPFTFNHGFADASNNFRTVMATTAGACSSCPRINYWSNPDVTFSGNPTGIVEGDPNAADNRKTLNQTATTVAAFREHALPIAGDFNNASSVMTPYWQAGAGNYTFIGLTHPSLSGMASGIGVSVKAFLTDGGIFGPVAEFTVNAGTTSRLFIVPSGHPSLNSSNIPNAQFITGHTVTGSGGIRIDALASNPQSVSPGGGFASANMLAYWGAVVFESGNTGFALEFIGDLTDSASHPGQASGRFPSGVR